MPIFNIRKAQLYELRQLKSILDGGKDTRIGTSTVFFESDKEENAVTTRWKDSDLSRKTKMFKEEFNTLFEMLRGFDYSSEIPAFLRSSDDLEEFFASNQMTLVNGKENLPGYWIIIESLKYTYIVCLKMDGKYSVIIHCFERQYRHHDDAVFLPGKLHGAENEIYIIYHNPDSVMSEKGCWEIERCTDDEILEAWEICQHNYDDFYDALSSVCQGRWGGAVYNEDDEYAEAYPEADFILHRDGEFNDEYKFIVDWAESRAKSYRSSERSDEYDGRFLLEIRKFGGGGLCILIGQCSKTQDGYKIIEYTDIASYPDILQTGIKAHEQRISAHNKTVRAINVSARSVLEYFENAKCILESELNQTTPDGLYAVKADIHI